MLQLRGFIGSEYDSGYAGFDSYHKTAVKILAYVTYVGKYQKACISRHAFYLVIFLTVLPKLFLTQKK